VPSGGARNRSGPPPDPGSLRSAGREWLTLPAKGREGPAPEWPLTRATVRELALWAQLWRKPQAILWQENGQEIEVAMHVRHLVLSEGRKAPTAARSLLRQQMDSLLLTLPALRAAGVRVGYAGSSIGAAATPIEDAEGSVPAARSISSARSIRDRLGADGAG
jgi:hypothetical protein